MSQKVGPFGGNKGHAFDDGLFDVLRKVIVGQNGRGVSYIKTEYEKDGKIVTQEHGDNRTKTLNEFVLNYPDEYITSIQGTYSDVVYYATIIVKTLTFKTSQGRTSPLFGNTAIFKSNFLVEGKDGAKLIGFHGRCGDAIDSLGAHFFSADSYPNVKKLETRGGRGQAWDDGVYDGVRNFFIGEDNSGVFVNHVKVEYVKGGLSVQHSHGNIRKVPEEFVLDYPNEHVTSVEGTYDDGGSVRSLTIKTSKGRISKTFGKVIGTKFVLEEPGYMLVGLRGRYIDGLAALGGNFAPIPMPPPAKKLEAVGGNGGAEWDDGFFDNVRKVYVGQGDSSVSFVKFEYDSGKKLVVGDDHGKKSILGTKEFEVDPDDKIVCVEGFNKSVLGATSKMITSLTFKTYNGQTSQRFGMPSPSDGETSELLGIPFGTKFVLQGGKIVGFHGRSSNVVHSLGAYITVSANPKLHGAWKKMEQKGKGPGTRCSHAIAQVGNKIYSFGGEFTPNVPIDKHLYVFDLETQTWSIAPATGDVPDLSCLGVCMVSIGSILYVFGGRDASRKYNGFYSVDTITNEWKLLTPVEEGPTPRSFHSMAADERNVYVFGGVSATARIKTLDAYNIVDQKWRKCSTPGDSFSIRGGAGLKVVQGKVWVVYGFTGYELDDVYYYNPDQDKWTQVETFGEKPSARSVFASAVAGKHIVIFGGEIDMDPLAHVGPGQLIGGTFALDTETLKWEMLDKFGKEDTPDVRGWSASTSGTINGNKGLVMLGGKAQSNERFGDLHFYSVDSA